MRVPGAPRDSPRCRVPLDPESLMPGADVPENRERSNNGVAGREVEQLVPLAGKSPAGGRPP